MQAVPFVADYETESESIRNDDHFDGDGCTIYNAQHGGTHEFVFEHARYDVFGQYRSAGGPQHRCVLAL